MPPVRARRVLKPPSTLVHLTEDNANEQSEKQSDSASPTQNKTQQLLTEWTKGVDNASLVFFRFLWGVLMMYECLVLIREDYYDLEYNFMRTSISVHIIYLEILLF